MKPRSNVGLLVLFSIVAIAIGSMASFTALNQAYAQGAGTASDGQDGGISSDVINAYKAAPLGFFLVVGLYLVSELILWLDSKVKSNVLALLRPYLVFAVSVLASGIFSLVSVGAIDPRAIVGAMTASLMLEIKSRKKKPEEAGKQPLPEAVVVAGSQS